MALLPLIDANGYRPLYVRPIVHSGDTVADAYRTAVTDHIGGGTLGAYSPITFPASWDVVLTASDSLATIEAAIANTNNINIGFAPGDYRSLGQITIYRRKLSGAPIFLGSTDGAQTHPYDLAEGNRVRLRRIRFQGGAGFCLYRLAFEGDNTTSSANRTVYIERNASTGDLAQDITVSHCMQQFALKGIFAGGWTSYGLSVQYNVGFDCVLAAGVDSEPCEMFSTQDSWVSCNEFFDGGGDEIVTNADTSGLVVENNCCYKSDKMRAKGDGTLWDQVSPIADYPYVQGEQNIDIKGFASQGNPAIFMKNRLWGKRKRPNNGTGSGAYGTAAMILSQGGSPYIGARYIVVVENIIGPSAMCINHANYNAAANAAGNNSINRNLLVMETYDDPDALHFQSNNHNTFLISTSTNQFLFNTLVFEGKESAGNYDPYAVNRGYQHDFQANLIIDCDQGFAGSMGGRTDYNAYVNTPDQSETNKLTFPDRATAGLLDYTFYRKLLTGPELYTINECVPPVGSSMVDYGSSATHLSGYGCLANAVAQGPEI
jgi:hypothetical protein